MTDLQAGKNETIAGTEREVRLQRAADRLLVLLGELLETLTPQQLDVRSVRSISSTLKDLKDMQGKKDEEAGKLTVALEGEVESYAQ